VLEPIYVVKQKGWLFWHEFFGDYVGNELPIFNADKYSTKEEAISRIQAYECSRKQIRFYYIDNDMYCGNICMNILYVRNT